MSTNRATHTSVVWMAIHFRWSGGSWTKLLSQVDYEVHRKIATNHPFWINEMNNIPGVPLKGRIFRASFRGSGKIMMLRQQHESFDRVDDGSGLQSLQGGSVRAIFLRSFSAVIRDVFAAAWAQHVCWLWEGPHLILGCTSNACVNVGKAGFESEVGHSWRHGNCWSKQGLREGGDSPCVEENAWKLCSAGQTCYFADISNACDAFHWKHAQTCNDFWKVPAHPSFTIVWQGAQTFL